jgi:lipopolysaccharide export system permease protein
MNRVFFRYIASTFWAPFGFGLGVFCLLLLAGSLFDSLNFFIRSGAGAGVFFRYVFYQTPYFVVKMTPIATLLAVLFSMGGLMSRGEWKAGLAGGWKPFDMVRPLLACSLLAAGGQFLLQETVAPDLYLRSTHLYFEKMRGKDDWQRLVKKNVSFSAGGDTFVSAGTFDGREKTMGEVALSSYDKGRLRLELSARSARWDPAAGWIFGDGVETLHREGGAPRIRRFPERPSGVLVPPGNLVLERLVPDGVSIAEVRTRLRLLESVGAPASGERTLLWVKLFAPLANPVMALIGAALALLMRGGNRLFSVGLAIGAGFLFWSTMIMGQAAGTAELVSPLAAGLGPVLLFGCAALWGLRRVRAI